MTVHYSQINPDIAAAKSEWLRAVTSARNMSSDDIAAITGRRRSDVNRKLAGGDSMGASRRFSAREVTDIIAAAEAIRPLSEQERTGLEAEIETIRRHWHERALLAETPGEFLKLSMTAMEISTKQLAEAIGLDRANLSAFVNDKRKPKDRYVRKVQAHLALDPAMTDTFKKVVKECYTTSDGEETTRFQGSLKQRHQQKMEARKSWVERIAFANPLAGLFAKTQTVQEIYWAGLAEEVLELDERGLTHRLERGFKNMEELKSLLCAAGFSSETSQQPFLAANQEVLRGHQQRR